MNTLIEYIPALDCLVTRTVANRVLDDFDMADSTSTPRILLLGATGYVGGSVLHHLLEAPHPLLSKVSITVLVRGSDRAAKLRHVYGVRVSPVLFNDLNDVDLIADLASQHDIVVNAGTGFHPTSAEAIVRALSKRQPQAVSGGEARKPWVVHTSGCSNISDDPLAGDDRRDRWFNDADPLAIYEHQKAADARAPYLQRTTELAVLDAGEETGVSAIVLQIPLIYGEGRGLFNTVGAMVPTMIKYVLDTGFGAKLGDGSGCIGVVHIDDLAELYVLIVQRILEDGGKALPSGKGGTIFPCVGIVLLADIAQGCVDAAFRKGVLPKPDGPQVREVREVSVDDLAPYLGGGELGRHIAQIGWGGHWNTIGTKAVQLGWRPAHPRDDFLLDDHFDFELEAMLAGKRVINLDKVIGQEKS